MEHSDLENTSTNTSKKRKFVIPDVIVPLVEQHDYDENEMDSVDIDAVLKTEKEERERVERTLRDAAYKLYKYRTCKSDVSPEEWAKLISGRILTKK